MKKLLTLTLGVFMALNLDAQTNQTASAIAEAITPDIQALAGNLGNDPARIFDYVHDQIRYSFYFGSKKGAEMTLLERSGNDFDQCALLSALLQAAGYSPGYQFGLVKIPYDSPNHQDLHHLLGLSFYNTNWAKTSNFFAYEAPLNGFSVLGTISGDTNDIVLQHIWVTLSLEGTNYYLDPSFKVSEPISGLANLASAMGLNTNTLWTDVDGFDATNYVIDLNEGLLRFALQTCWNNLSSYLSNSAPNATVAQVIGGQQIVSSVGVPLQTSLLFPSYTSNGFPLLNWTNQPTNFMATFSLSVGGINQKWYMPQLQGNKISLIFDSFGNARLYTNDSLLQTAYVGESSPILGPMSATLPYGGWNTNENAPVDTGIQDESWTCPYQTTNASYAVFYAFEASPQLLQSRQQKLDEYLQEGLAETSDQVITETLNVMGMSYMLQKELMFELVSDEGRQSSQTQYSFGRMAQGAGEGYAVDIDLELDATYPTTGIDLADYEKYYQGYAVSGYFASALEHGIIEQSQNEDVTGGSTVKMLEIASTNGQKIWLAAPDNWSTVEPLLELTYSEDILDTLTGYIGEGDVLLLPENGSNSLGGPGSWAGSGFVVLAGDNSLFFGITGGLNGGQSSDLSATVNPGLISDSANNVSTFYNPASATASVGLQLGADPVSMVDGSFQITSADLSVGQTEPRGLNLTRYYSSARRNSNPAGMAPGWLHNYYCNVFPFSDPAIGLGKGTAQQMAPLIVATYAALNMYSTNLDAGNWTTTALIAKWGIDQLINTAVSVNLGKDTIEFAKQPDGSFTPPANCAMSLTETGGGYSLQERHGRTFQFGDDNLLTNIVDQYGQSLKLTYNSSSLVSTVTDWKNRSLAFTYTGGALTSVADSAGRSVSYAYTNGELTFYTDPEQKSTTYAYDANNELVATFDALNQLVESNYYDGFGHITTQLTQGATNKTWQIYASGYQTVEIDPAGDQQIYTYDNKSRLIDFEDGMGNVTQTFYDGQDHVVQTISPLNETNLFIYDGSNNLIETIDPLGFSNTYVFDSQNNLITSTDARGNSSHFGYNAQFSLTGFTNGNGDWTLSSYNSDGTLASRQDSGGTTSFGYDSYGQLSSITYPDSSSESFVNSALGDPTSHTDARGFTTTFAYNNRRQLTNTVAPTNLTTSATYDANANISTKTDARGNMTSNTWGVTRHLLATTLPTTPQGTPIVTNTYDTRDWLLSTKNPLNKITYYTNDAAHRLIATTDPLQRATLFAYDNDGHQTNVTDAASEKTAQSWDSRGSLVSVIDAATNVVGRAYDGAGNLIFLTNRNGKVWRFQYDGANRLTNTISPLGHGVTNSYNNRGLLAATTNGLGQATLFGYDARGRMISQTNGARTNTYQYDGNNNLTMLADAGRGTSLSWAYDAYNRATSFTDAAGYEIQYRYDANGNLTNLIYPGNRIVKYYYDGNNRLTNVTDWASRQTTFTYDLAGHVTSLARPNNTIRTMAYDNDGELTNIVERTTSQFPIAFYTLHYNAAGRSDWEFKGPLPHAYTPPTRAMTFDNDNRLATFNGTGVTVDADGNLTYGPGTNNTFGTYTYDPRNELTSAGGLTYGYDPSGTRASTFDGTNSIQFVTDPRTSQVLMRLKNPASTNLIYAESIYPSICGLFMNGTLPMGLNSNSTFTLAGFTGALEALNGDWTCYYAASFESNCLVDFLEDIGVDSTTNQPAVLIYHPTSETVTSYYVSAPGLGLLYEIDETATTTNTAFYHYDCRGSTVTLTDSNGNPTDIVEYSPYGTTTYRYGTNDTPFLYNGQFGVQTDPNGLLYMRARYYNPYISRFVNADPSGFGGGLNFYAFCDGNPISEEDPFGLDPAFSPGIGLFSGLTAEQEIQASQTAAPFVGGLVVGAAGATVVGAGAVGLVSLGVPQSVVSGGLFVAGVAGVTASGYSIYNNPSVNNIAFNVGGLGGGLLVGSVSANYVASALSPSGYQPSGASIASLAWKDTDGNINTLAFLADWLLPGAEVGPMSTGPDTSGATGTVAGAGAGVVGATDWLGNPLSSSSTGKPH